MKAGKTKVMVVESMQRRRLPAGGTAAPTPSFTCGLSTPELVEELPTRKAKSCCMRRRCAELGLQYSITSLCTTSGFNSLQN